MHAMKRLQVQTDSVLESPIVRKHLLRRNEFSESNRISCRAHEEVSLTTVGKVSKVEGV